MKLLLAQVTIFLCLAALTAPAEAKTGYLQEGRYYASPAGTVAWLEVTDRLLLVSDNTRTVAALNRSNGQVAWTHHPSGGRVDLVALSPDRSLLVVAGVDLEVLNVASGSMRWAMRMGCKRPCENRVQAVVGNAIYVSGGGVTHRWLWRYRLSDGKAEWANPLAIAHPRAFATSSAGPAYLLEANAPFGVRRLDISATPSLASRTLWTSRAGGKLVPQQLAALRDGRAVVVGPLPGGGMPPIGMVPGAGTLPPQTLALTNSGMAGARVSRVESHNRLLAAVARKPGGAQAVAVWDINRPGTPRFTGLASRQVALLGTRVKNGGLLTMALRNQGGTRLVGLDDTTGQRAFDKRLDGVGKVTLMPAGNGTVALIQSNGTHGALALLEPRRGDFIGVGALDRARTSRVARQTPTGLYVGAGRGILSLLRVPLSRAFPELEEAVNEGDAEQAAALQTALRWTPDAKAAMTAMVKGAARTNARTLRKSSASAKVTGLTGLLRSASSASANDAFGAIQPLLMIAAELGLGPSPQGNEEEWSALAAAVEGLLKAHGLTMVKARAKGGEPELRSLVVLVAAGLLLRNQHSPAMTLLARWLRLPVTPEPGVEAMLEVAAVGALERLFASQIGGLASADDAQRHAAARLLAAFQGTKLALGEAEWLEERARPVLTPSRPESMRAAAALGRELKTALERRTHRGRLGLGGPGCALTCRTLEHACMTDCHGNCARRYRKCLKTCKRKRRVKVGSTPDACR